MNKIFYHKINKNIARNDLGDFTLSSEEKKRAKAFKFQKDFNLYVSGKLLARKVIASYLGLKPEEIKFKIDKYDRPFLDHSDFDFNLSHSGKYVVLAISDTRVGIDIEKIKPIDLNLSKECFHDKERKFLLDSNDDQLVIFYKIWTLKESFVKAVGEGLSYPLKNFYFDLKNSQPTINILDTKDNVQWNFKICDIDPDYKLAVCAKKENLIDEPQNIIDLI